jgi:MFS family permease
MTSAGQYGQIWGVPGGPLLIVGGFVARVGNGVTILAWLLLVQQTTGSYGIAATVGAAISLATACFAPIGGRLADRLGPSVVLVFCGTTYAVTQLTLLAAVLAHLPVPLLCLVAAVSGATYPPVSPALKAGWSVLTCPESGRGSARTAAMAADATLYELVFVVGPLLLSGFVVLGRPISAMVGLPSAAAGPAAAVCCAALLTGVGTVALATGRAMRALRPVHAPTTTRGLGPLREPRFVMLLVCAAGVAFSFGASPVAIAAYAKMHDGAAAESMSGTLIAIWSLGSVLAGIWFGTRTFRAPLNRQFVVLLIALTAGYVLWTPMPDSWTLSVFLFVTGAAVAPVMTVEASLVTELAAPTMLNEAYTWITTTNLSVSALGTVVGGILVDQPGGPTWGFLAAAAGGAVAAVVAGLPGALAPRPAAVPAASLAD